jgi:elongator complex protein 3
MIRLRINKDESYANEILYDHALIRELHVYGIHSGIGDSENKDNTQHKGLGKKLIKAAEEICYLEGRDDITVISGVGVKEYYRKIGFTDYHTYLTKKIEVPMKYIFSQFIFVFVLFLIFMHYIFWI